MSPMEELAFVVLVVLLYFVLTLNIPFLVLY